MIQIHILIFTLVQQIPAEARVTFSAVGDIMLDRGIKRAILQHDINYPFDDVRDLIRGFDLAFCNLECPISAEGVSSGKIYCFRADTAYFAGPRDAGFDIFCLANNHIIDWGLDACFDTRDRIENARLHAIGVYASGERPTTPVMISVQGLTFAFFAFLGAPLMNLAWPENKAGPVQAALDTIVVAIQSVRQEVDFVIVSFHWGNEYIHLPDKRQIDWAHQAIDAGADLVVGHHPHVLQSIEHYRNGIILYSLGNFVFDQRKPYQCRTGIFSCVFKKGRIDSASFHPVWIEDYQPRLAHDTLYCKIIAFMRNISLDFNTICIESDSTILLPDSSGNIAIQTPLRYARINAADLRIYRNSMILCDTGGRIIDSLHLAEGMEVKDCCVLPDSEYLVGMITGGIEDRWGEAIALVRATDTAIVQLWRQHMPEAQPWKIIPADIDHDGVSELCIGTHAASPRSPDHTNRLTIYDISGKCVFPKWPAPHAHSALTDFTIKDTDGDNLDELVVLETLDSGHRRIITYQWLGFDFFKYRILPDTITTQWITDIY